MQIIGGGGHCLFLDKFGIVSACGWNNRGQLGIGSLENSANIQQIPSTHFKSSISQLACGWDCSAAIDCQGNVYSWGSNTYQQLGVGDISYSFQPIEITLPNNDQCIRIEFGLRYTCFITRHCLYFVGQQRALSKLLDKSKNVISWNNIDWWKLMNVSVEHIASGQHHIVFCEHGKENQLQSLGANKFHQSESFEIGGQVKMLKAGWTHNGLINSDDNVLLWGRNNYGQLGRYVECDFKICNKT